MINPYLRTLISSGVLTTDLVEHAAINVADRGLGAAMTVPEMVNLLDRVNRVKSSGDSQHTIQGLAEDVRRVVGARNGDDRGARNSTSSFK